MDISHSRLFPTLAALLLFAGCEALQGPEVKHPALLEIVAGDRQTAPARTPLPVPLAVRVVTASGEPIAGQPVFFEIVSGGGTLSAPTARTNASGVAQVRWTMGPFSTRAHQVRAFARSMTTGEPLPAAVFTAAIHVEAPATLVRLIGDNQSAAPGTLLRDSLAVRVLDARGIPIEGATVRWSVTAGAGHVTPAITTSDSTGLAWARWTLGSVSVLNRVAATVDGLSPTVFTASATIGSVSRLGDQQAGVVAQPLADSVGVLVLFANGTPAADAPVVWTVTAQGGSISPTFSTTNSAGIARAAWTLGTAAGQRTLTATVNGKDQITFTATAVAGAPAAVTPAAGSGQTATAGTTLAGPLVVRVVDRFGNPVGGQAVTWESSSGSISGGTQTGADGQASAQWTLGNHIGDVSATATVTTANATFSAQFTARSVIPPNASFTKASDLPASSTPGTTLNPSVRLAFPGGTTPIAGQVVSWSITSGGGSLSASSSVSATTSTTDASGVASVPWTLGSTAGTNTLVATVGGVQTTLTFTVTTTAP